MMRITTLFLSLFGVFCALAGPCWAQDSFDTPIAITGVTASPDPNSTIENATIIIHHGRITAIGNQSDLPRNARVISASGLYAYPGFIDAATHLGIKDKKPSDDKLDLVKEDEYPVNQGPRTHMQQANRLGVWPHLGVSDFYKQDDDAMDAYRAAGFTTALVTPHPDIMTGAGDVIQLSGSPLRSATLASRITQILGFGDFEDISYSDGRAYPGSKMGSVAMLRQLYMDAEWYRARNDLYVQQPNLLERPPIDPVLDAMQPLLDRDQMWIFSVDTPNEIHHALDLALEFNQRIAILGGKEAWKVADRLARENVPVIVSLDFDEKPKLAPKPSKGNKTYTTVSWTPEFEKDFLEPKAVREDRVRLWEEQVNNLHALQAAGVQVAITGRDQKKPDKLMEQIEKALELELSPKELLEALTRTPARILGLDDQIGTLTPGKLANITLLTAPLGEEDSQVRHVFIDGEQFTFQTNGDKEDDESDDEKADEEGEDEESEDTEAVDVHSWSAEFASDRKIELQTNRNILLQNATVVPVTGPIQYDTDILIRNGKIRAIGTDILPRAVRDGVTMIDLTGYWIMPGIIDPHSHIAVTGINEWTQSISSEVRQADVVDHTALSIYNALAGGVTTIHTMHGSANSMGGQNAVLKLKYMTSPRDMLVTSGPRIVKFALGENVTRGRPIPRFPNSRMGVESVFRHAFNEAIKYNAEWAAYEEGFSQGKILGIPRRDLRLDAISDILAGNIWVHSHCYRGDEMLRLLNVAQDYGFRIATLQHVLEGYRVAPEMYNHGVGGSTFADWWSYKKEAFDAIPYNAAMMMKEGIVTSLNSDSSDDIRHLNLEAGKTMRYGGLSAEDAIKLITINPAIQIGLDSRIGSIEVGKDGDLAVFTGHPLDTHSKNMMTIIEGDIFFVHPDLKLDGSTPGPASTFIPEPPRDLLPLPEPSSTYAIVGATIHPVTGDTVENGTLLIRDGKIVDVLASDSRPAGASIVDASGLHVYPGLINAATQMGLSEISGLSQTVDSRDLATYQPELRALSAINPHSEHIPVSLCEGITLSHSVPRGGIISGQGSAIQMVGWTTPELLRSNETGLVIDLPVLPNKENIDDEEKYKKRLEKHQESFEKTEAFMRDAKHYNDLRSSTPNMKINMRLEAMRPYVTGTKTVFFRAQSYKKILQSLKFAETYNLKAVILGGADAWKLADTLAEKNVPVIVTSIYTLPFSSFGGGDSYERFDAHYENPGKLHEAGVLVATASTGTEFARQLASNAGFAVAQGMTQQAALESITINAAKILGLEDSVGSLESGKIADVIITTGDPTQAGTRTVGMFIAGKPVTLDSLHERSHEKFTNRPKPDLKPTGDLRGPKPMRVE
ncbi:MAG: amidohydrolase family protein [Candidatus Hydrogenedentota bacterium]